MTEPEERPPFVRCDPPVPILVEHEGARWPGLALAYCGRRVTVEFSVDVGAKHLLVVDADLVART